MEKVLKVLFMPLSIVAGLIAGIIGRKAFEQIWGVVDDEEPPTPKHRETGWLKLIAALIVEGAIFRAVRGLVDRSTRIGFARLTGTWPGEARPEPE
jgi:hypothetical protein